MSVVAGHLRACAILDDAGLKCWGDNTYGLLGAGGQTSRGDEANEMGDLLPCAILSSVPVPVISVALAWHHSCALLNDTDVNGVKCWGPNFVGEVGGSCNPPFFAN